MSNKGHLDNPIDRVGLICNKPVTSSEIHEAKGTRSKLLAVLAMAFFLTAGCAVGKKTIVAQDASRKPAAAAPRSDSEKTKKKKTSNATLDIRNEKSEKKDDDKMKEEKEWIRELNRLRYDKKYYMKCYNNWECDQV